MPKSGWKWLHLEILRERSNYPQANVLFIVMSYGAGFE